MRSGKSADDFMCGINLRILLGVLTESFNPI